MQIPVVEQATSWHDQVCVIPGVYYIDMEVQIPAVEQATSRHDQVCVFPGVYYIDMEHADTGS